MIKILFLSSFLFLSTLVYALEIDFETESNLPLVYLNVALKGGSVTDPKGQMGITNFMGEMLLRGTKSKTKDEIDLLLDQMGAKLEVESRAEALIVRAAVLSSELGRFLPLLTEIITTPSFPDDQINKLRSEIISGIQEELAHDGSLASRKFTKFLFQDHPYGNSIVGLPADLNTIKRDNLLAHYSLQFNPNSILVMGSGDATAATITAWAQQMAASLNQNGNPPLPVTSAPKNSNSRRLLLIDKPDRTQTQIFIGQIGLRMTDKSYFPIYVGNDAFGGGSFSSILTDEIRVKRGWSYGANSSFRQGLQPRSWAIHLYPASKDAAAALSYTLKLLQDLKTNGLTPKQFEFTKQSLINSSGFTYNTPRKRVENKLLEKTLNLPSGFIKSFAPEIAKTTLVQTNAALKDFIRPEHLSIAVLATARNLKESLIKASGVSNSDVTVVNFTQE